MKTNVKNSVKVDSKKVDLLQLSESIKNVAKEKSNSKEDLYIYFESEIEKAEIKLNSFKDKYKGIKELSSKEKRNLSLSKHLSSTRSKIRDNFEKMINNYFEIVESNKLNNSDQKELAKITFTEFFESRFKKFKKDSKIYSDMFCNSGNSLEKKINNLCNIWNS